ncbi:helicase HerA domain-containing protein [Micromonospora echinaurantiaca]|uniref:helicase HerA domain-containing protein n=1 Tax=Micromonospora echinaurantiaca TaxID=47857 RepID=UPI00379B8727
MTSLLDRAANKTKSLSPLATLINKGCSPIGGIYQLDYTRALVLTDDHRKGQAGGVPLGGYLLAVAGKATSEGFTLDDEEMILLRVRGTAPLPHEADLVQTRLAVVRDATNSEQTFDDVTDDLTLDELQQSAFDCEVLGTFYALQQGGATLEFGADIDNVISAARYQVFLPSAEVLSWLASYPDSGADDTLPLGVVRFSSTRRRAQVSGTDQAEVRVHVGDFISRKTAVFGMTRTGKSNTIKTLVTAVHRYASTHGERIGQVIFDPQGEYANVNQQDGTGLRLLGTQDTVRVYRFGADGTDPQVLPLGMNFFDLAYLDAATSFVNASVLQQYGSYAYVKNFTSINWEEPPKNNKAEWTTWSRARLGFYGLLALCDFRSPYFSDSANKKASTSLEFTWKKDDYDEFNAVESNRGLVSPPTSGATYRLQTPQAARAVTLFMANKGTWNTSSSNASDPRPFGFIAEVLNRASAKAAIRTLTDFHTAHSEQRVEEQVWEDMVEGRLAIVDLAYGSGDAPRIISENVVNHILNEANIRFRANAENVRLQVVVEEAHNLFERGAKETAGNPWLRLSKEAAKYGIGLVYATQEVTSVDQRILSNTSNWLVAHLNSDNETRELSHYYDYKTWAESLRRCEDVGFVRMKTYSGKYIVPIQISRFDHDMINQARVAAGLTPLIVHQREESV